MIKVLYSCFERKLTAQELATYVAVFPTSIRNKILKFQRWQDVQACLYGKLLLLKGLEQFGIAPDLEKLQYTAYSRPYIDKSIDFNISHSGCYVTCVLSDSAKVGIDIEQVNSIPIEDFACYMLPEEWEKITRASNKYYEFYEYWTRKESIIKADGRGLSIPLEEIVVSGNRAVVENATWYLKKIKLVDEYIVHVAADAEEIEPVICKVEL
ncbi:4'-phosphopantetheinyl transferase superfamily protein [Hymenobacter sp. HSC-4F20]|uniref:4'-phosphopantetheinyl transferase family protein n=1 Tax=Hymenobacter sp. HSC-4F20 TaxID=2864135 RepID=UPI001C72A341|nr:4'-phosphopantetheinyl transferase superfamily protein [Hymenobacter sp. HSC-4F20]MBX0293005.1 4'-phosphopantetheinyl transferase superfamily protein [Hymenobacter sp. HSC-4F20]